MGGACGAYGQGRGVHMVLVGKLAGKRPLGRPRRRWENNIKMDLQEVGGACGDWMGLAQDRDRWRAFVITVMNLRVPKMRGISWLAAEPVSFSRWTLLHVVSKYCLGCVISCDVRNISTRTASDGSFLYIQHAVLIRTNNWLLDEANQVYQRLTRDGLW